MFGHSNSLSSCSWQSIFYATKRETPRWVSEINPSFLQFFFWHTCAAFVECIQEFLTSTVQRKSFVSGLSLGWKRSSYVACHLTSPTGQIAVYPLSVNQNVLLACRDTSSFDDKCLNTSVVLFGCETWSLTLREERRLRVFENRVLRRMFGTKRDGVTGEWRKWFVLCTLYFSNNQIEKNEMDGACSKYGERSGVYRVLVGNLRERDRLEDPGIDGRIILRWISRKWDVGVWTGSIWLRIGTGGGPLWKR